MICGTMSHDRAHCFKPGGGMAGKRPAHWLPEGGNQNTSTSACPTPTVPTAPSGVSMSSVPAVAAVVLDSPDSWVTRDYDLSC